ncbi:unnamed protein product, partial [Oikopleura dioica]
LVRLRERECVDLGRSRRKAPLKYRNACDRRAYPSDKTLSAT